MAIFDTGAGGKQNLKFVTAEADSILEGYVGADAKGKPREGVFTIEEQILQQEAHIAEINDMIAAKALPTLNFITAGASQILAGYAGANAKGEKVEGLHQCFEGYEIGMVSSGTISANGTTNVNVTLASEKRPKVVLTFACYQDKLTINDTEKTITGIDTQFGVGITVDDMVEFEGQHYSGNTRRHKAIITNTGFRIECKNTGTSSTNGYYCDWIAFY